MGRIKRIGILTAGGDCPGLNAAIRAIGKTASAEYGIEIVGIRDGYLGLVEERMMKLDNNTLANILTLGGTILGTSRIKPHRYTSNGRTRDVRGTIVANCRKHGIDALVCIGGGGTHKNARRLMEKGMRIITLPKTIDNDIAHTDTSIGFDTALGIATEAIDRLHSTAHSHHRIIVAEIMGHRAGWLALGSGLASGADVILIPEIAYDVERVAAAIRRRSRRGRNFSIVAVAEGALSKEYAAKFAAAKSRKAKARSEKSLKAAKEALAELDAHHAGNTLRLANELERLTGLTSRLTILGYVQRGGTPSPADRVLASKLGAACARLIHEDVFGVMVASQGDSIRPVPIEEVAGNRKEVPLDHPWIASARGVGTCLGD